MSQPVQDPSGPPPAAPGKKDRKGLAIGLVVGFLLGTIIGCTASGDDTATTARPAAGQPTATVTVTRQAAENAAPEPDPEPEPEPTAFTPRPKDFKVGVKIRQKQCFGSAGCNVTYRIDPEYVGDQPIPDTGTVEVTYEVRGGEDGPSINTFSIEGGEASYPSEESLSTKSTSSKLKAVVTDVSYDD